MHYALTMPAGAFHTITAPEHCAWPNLTLLPNGEIGAVIFNQPSHGRLEGDVELWVSDDGAETWALRSQVTQHEPGTVRMNVAAGLNQDGEIVVLCSGWDMGFVDREITETDCLLPEVWISADNGETWELAGEAPAPPGSVNHVPFGDVVINGDELVVSSYACEYEKGKLVRESAWAMGSGDGGRSWGDHSSIGRANYNETDLLITRQGTWLAVCRTHHGPVPEGSTGSGPANLGASLVLFTSEDEGRTWQPQEYLSLPMQHPPHLLELADGTVLLTYGSRIEAFRGVVGRVSADDGETWSPPFNLVGGFLPGSDHGYPSSVQLADGQIVTAYYCSATPWYQRYHMGVVRWNLEMVNVVMPG